MKTITKEEFIKRMEKEFFKKRQGEFIEKALEDMKRKGVIWLYT